MRINRESLMNSKKRFVSFAFIAGLCVTAWAQPGEPGAAPPEFDGPPPFGPPGFGPDGPGDVFIGGGPGPGMRQNVELVKQFDKDSNGWLNSQERQAARKFLEQQGAAG